MWRVYFERVTFVITSSSFGLGSNRCERRELLLGMGRAELDGGDSNDSQRGIVPVVLVRVWLQLLDGCGDGH
jgi:hypothetical protein